MTRVPSREVVGAVHDHVPTVGEDPLHVLGREPLLVGHHRDIGVERFDRPLRGEHLWLSEGVGRVDDLALQVRVVDHVGIHDAERADARRGEVERSGGAEPACADQEHSRVEQLLLALLTDLRDEEVAAVARALLGAERLRGDELEPVPLPVGEAPRHRGHARVAEVGEGSRGERRPRPSGAVDDDLARLVWDERFDPRLEVATLDVDGAGDVPLLPLVGLAHVEEERPVARGERVARRGRGDLVDLRLGGGEVALCRSALLSRV